MPTFPNTDTCKAPRCRASIIWVESVNGKPMPLDYLPHVDGNIDVELDEARGVRVGKVLTGFDLELYDGPPGSLYRHHRASCLDPDWRRLHAGGRR